MNRLKKVIIILCLIFSSSFIIAAVLSGYIYYHSIKTYTDYDKTYLKAESLDNLFIKTYIPIEVYSTEDTPYVEFTQTFIDLAGLAPEYDLKVESKQNSTYITLNKVQEFLNWMGIKENKASLKVYLPKKTMDRLSIENEGILYSIKQEQIINLQGIDVENLQLKMKHAEVNLNGHYHNVILRMDSGKLNVVSSQITQLYLEGNIEQYLSGEFKKITSKDNSSDINIDSHNPCEVGIDSREMNLYLNGQYKLININGEHNNIDIESETECSLRTKGNANHINVKGTLEQIRLGEKDSQVQIDSYNLPQKIQLDECRQGTDLTLTLPSNIEGFKVMYIRDSHPLTEDEFKVYQNYLLDKKTIESDFKLERSISSRGELIYNYQKGNTIITLKDKEDVRLKIMDGNYTMSTIN